MILISDWGAMMGAVPTNYFALIVLTSWIFVSFSSLAYAGTNTGGIMARNEGSRCLETAVWHREVIGADKTLVQFTSGDSAIVPQLIGADDIGDNDYAMRCYVGIVRRPSGIAFSIKRTNVVYSGSLRAAWFTVSEQAEIARKVSACQATLGKRAIYHLQTHHCDIL